MILAVVGTRVLSEKAAEYASLIIADEICSGRWDSYVTGDPDKSNRCGIDAIVVGLCGKMGVHCLALAPVHRRWKPGGFEERNRLIVASCDRLLAIRDTGGTSYGSGWTADLAAREGKLYARVEISSPPPTLLHMNHVIV